MKYFLIRLQQGLTPSNVVILRQLKLLELETDSRLLWLPEVHYRGSRARHLALS